MPLLLAKKEELDLVVVDPNASKDPKAPKRPLLENFFRPLIEDLKRLANPTDLGLKWKAKVSIAFICADNVALNKLANISTHWRGQCCSDCFLFHENWQNIRAYLPATVETQQQRDFRLHRHTFSEITDKETIYAVDVFHDLYEGN